jgi:putative tricarboxylic transport membrane protein
MVRIDRYIALCLLAFSIGYGYLAWMHPLLPFEVRMPFKPNTMPLGLAGIGIILSSMLLFLPSSDGLEKDADGWRGFAWNQALILVGMMVLYALLLRPLGFILSTSLFLIAASRLLGETHWLRSIITAILSSALIWYLVDVVLGIYLVPLPKIGAL